FICTDYLGNIYVVRNKNFIVKYNKNGDSISNFNAIQRGKISQIDATNPMKTLVYFANFSQILVLDNMLSLKNTINLKKINRFNIPCIANSTDGNIWFYDPNGELVKIDEDMKISLQMPLRNILPFVLDPVYMIEQNRNLYICDTSKGVFAFDRFGFYQYKLNIKTNMLQVFEKQFVYVDNNFIKVYDSQLFTEKALEIPYPDDVLNIRIERDNVFILRKESFDIYKFENE
nr:hypothetical protein [Chitinophagaceae bacterium]